MDEVVRSCGGVNAAMVLMKRRNYRPIPVSGPEVETAVYIVAASIDIHGVWFMDSGGGSHLVKWRQ